MKAAVCETNGPPEVVRIREVPTPVPADGEVLVKASATTVNSGDARVRALRVPRGLRSPMRLSTRLDQAETPDPRPRGGWRRRLGRKGVTRFRPGDRVVASRGFDFGCHAEYVTVAEDGAIATIPDDLSYQDAVALCFGGTTAVYFFGRGKLAADEEVLINGASGAVGTMAVQLAKHLGAEVTGVCSGANVQVVKGLGTDHVIDYSTQDFTTNGLRYDAIMDNHGNAPYRRVKESLKPGGRFLMVIGGLGQMVAASWTEGGDRRQRDRYRGDGRKLSLAHVAGGARNDQTGDRFGASLRADRGGPSPSRQRPQGRQRRAHIWAVMRR